MVGRRFGKGSAHWTRSVRTVHVGRWEVLGLRAVGGACGLGSFGRYGERFALPVDFGEWSGAVRIRQKAGERTGALVFRSMLLEFPNIFLTFPQHFSNMFHPPRAHHAAELVPTIFRTLAEHPPSISLHIFVDCSAWVYTRPQATQLSPQLFLFEREPRSSSHLAGVGGFPICFRAPEGRKGCPGRRGDSPTSPTSGVGSHLLRLEFRLLGFLSASRRPVSIMACL